MAISVRASGTWSVATTQSPSVTIPAGYQAGDLGILVSAWRPYTVTGTVNQSWNEIIDLATGSTANGTGVGSSRLYVAYKVFTSASETNPTLTRSGAITPGGQVIIVLQKGSTDGPWDATALSGAVEQAMGSTAMSHVCTTTAAISTNDWVFALTGVADDSATFTRATTAISGGPSWSGNVVEYPATHASSTTGNDMAADNIYRVASSSVASGQSITITATLSAAERVGSVLYRVRFVGNTYSSSFTANAIIGKTQTNAPFVRTVGTAASGTTSLSMTIPASNDGDLLVALMELPINGDNDSWSYSTDGLMTDGVAWSGPYAVSTYTYVATTEVTIWAWFGVKGQFGGAETTAAISFDVLAPDHAYGLIVSTAGVGGADPDADYLPIFDLASWSSDTSVTTVYSTDPENLPEYQSFLNSLFLFVFANPTDASTARFSGWVPQTTPDSGYLDDTITEIFDAGTTTGNGGGLGLATAYPSWVNPNGDQWGNWWEMSGIQATQASATAVSMTFEIHAPLIQAWILAYPNFSVDAILTWRGFPADATLKRTQSTSFTASAVIWKTQTASFSVNAAIRKVQSGTFPADAIRLSWGAWSDIYENGVGGQGGTFTANAVLKKTQATSFPAAAVLLKAASGTFTASSLLKKTVSGTFSVSACIKAAVTGSTTANAVLKRSSGTLAFTAGAVRLRTPPGLFNGTFDTGISGWNPVTPGEVSWLSNGGPDGSGCLKGYLDDSGAFGTTYSEEFPVAPGQLLSFSADMWSDYTQGASLQIQFLESDGSPIPEAPSYTSGVATSTWSRITDVVTVPALAASATVVPQTNGQSFFVESRFDNIFLSYAFTANSVIRKAQSSSFAANAVIQKTATSSFATDAVVATSGFTAEGDFTADAILRVSRSGSLDVAATVLGHVQAQRAVDAVLKGTKAGSFGVAATLRGEKVGSLQAAAAITRPASGQFLVAATLLVHREQPYTLDAVKRRTAEGSLGLFAVLKRQAVSSTTANAVITVTRTGSTHLDALLRGAGAGTFGVQAVIEREVQGSQSVEAVVRTTAYQTVLTDAVLRAGRAGLFTANAVLRRSQTGDETLDAVIRRTTSSTTTADALVLRGQVGSTTVDAVVGVQGSGSLLADAVVRRVQGSSFTADAIIIRFPTVESTIYGTVDSNSTQWTLEYPPDIQPDDRLLAVLATDGVPNLSNWPDGWTELGTRDAPGGSGRLHIWRYGPAGGTETGTFTVDLDASEQGVWRVIRVSGQDIGTYAELGPGPTGTDNHPDSGELTPSWGQKATLWWSLAAIDDGRTNATVYPAGYDDGHFSDKSGSGPQGAALVSARREYFSATDDPGPFTIDLSSDWVATTIAMPPFLWALTVNRSFAAGAIVQAARTGSFDADAVLFGSHVQTFTANAVLMPVFVADAIVLGHPSSSFSVDARIMPRFSVDALILRPATGVFTVNAWVEGAGVAAFAVDAVIKTQRSDSTLVQAVLGRAVQGDATLDAVVLRPEAGQSVLDAVLLGTQTPVGHRVDAVVLALGSDAFDVDGTVLAEQLGALSSDAVILAHSAASLTTDATIKRTGSGSLVVEAVVRGVAQRMLPVDAVIEAPQNASTSADAILLAHRAGVWAVDASIAGASGSYIAVDAIITRTASATISASAVLSRTNDSAFVLAALLKTVTQASFLAGAVIEATRTGGVATDAVFLSPQTSSFSLDATLIPGVGSGSFPLEAVLGRPYQGTFAADALLSSPTAGAFTVDALSVVHQFSSFTLDALVVATAERAFGVDAVITAGVSGTFGVDASISGLIPQEIEATVSAVTIAATVTAGTLDATASAVTYASANTAATIDFTWYFTRRNLFRVGAELAGAFTLDAEVA